jgi:hypothetical protein
MDAVASNILGISVSLPVADQLKAFLARRRNGESAPGRRCDLLGVNHQNREDFLVISDSEPDC